MKQLDKSLCDFIKTFKLVQPLNGICFEAKLYFFSGQTKIESDVEIHIVTITVKALDILYILTSTTEIEDLPSMFILEDYEISFNRKDGLKIIGTSDKWGVYTLIIQPNGKNCIEPSYQELNSKIYN